MEDAIRKALNAKVIAVVGLSKDPSKPSHDVASYLRANGFKIIPINPTADFILGEKSYNSLLDLPGNIKHELDVVDIFRRPEDVPMVVKEAAQIHLDYLKPSVVWMQLGIINETAAKMARDAGMAVVMDRCMKIEHRKTLTQNPFR
ncbi:MAG TPA: CoA-binding protein [Methylomirabilota bacterium]|nr:CoA-binding protein [Methylomirabilota bacterium]